MGAVKPGIILPYTLCLQEQCNQFAARRLMIYMPGLLPQLIFLAHTIVKMRNHTLLYVNRLAGIDHLVLPVFKKVNSGNFGEAVDLFGVNVWR